MSGSCGPSSDLDWPLLAQPALTSGVTRPPTDTLGRTLLLLLSEAPKIANGPLRPRLRAGTLSLGSFYWPEQVTRLSPMSRGRASTEDAPNYMAKDRMGGRAEAWSPNCKPPQNPG